MKKAIIFILTFLILLPVCNIPSEAAFKPPFEVEEEYAYVVSADDSASVIYDSNSEVRVNPGALNKVAAAAIVIENCPDLSVPVEASSKAIRRIEQCGGTTAGILSGEILTVEQLLYCMLVYNANDAAAVLAEYCAGSEEKFVEMMNELTVKLGLSNTLFADPGGYSDAEQYSTARDIAEIFKYCMKSNVFEKIISTFLYEIPATNRYHETRYLKTTDFLINKGVPDYYFQYVKGGKSAYTKDDKCHLVSMAQKDGYSYLCVILNAGEKDYDSDDISENMAFVTTRKLYEWVFENIKLRVVADTSVYVGEVEVRLSDKFDYVSLVPAEKVSALVPSGANAKSVLIEPLPELTPDSIDAPVKAGDIIGRAKISYAGEIVAEVDLAAAFDVESSSLAVIGDKILKVLKSTVFRIIVLAAVIVVVPLCFVVFRKKKTPAKNRPAGTEKNNKR